ncbi:hypothetical protein [Adhaeribacter rhizoryzae]|uniref:Uncharacterized protein n=1 Tax=Adhaeribacter rhizoryzae TaxID=2607907 RepID=A0A5M6D9A1_9BACT|nr:hypothetical protein [Adhaeribacter rhizoryzae]KAA5542499.1 hypothetical protein F0145_18795 [Adhaeribacter rhizoryzae]
MKKSNIALLGLALIFTAGMLTTGFILKKEAAKINLNDPLRNYETTPTAAFKVLKISGSNGYPIHIQYDTGNSLTVLRRRKSFLKAKNTADTLEIIFSGANIPLDEASKNTTPAGIIIKTNAVNKIANQNTFVRIIDFRKTDLDLALSGQAVATFSNCQFPALNIRATGQSRFGFDGQNIADNFNLNLQNSTIGFLKNIQFAVLQHQVGDSAAVVLSNQVMAQVFNQGQKKLMQPTK